MREITIIAVIVGVSAGAILCMLVILMLDSIRRDIRALRQQLGPDNDMASSAERPGGEDWRKKVL